VSPLLLAALLAAAAAAPSDVPAGAPAAAPAPIRRLALVVSANDGGPGRPRLRYARTDADRLARVLQQLGGVAPADTLVVPDATASSLRAALDAVVLRATRARAGARVEVVLYYSGHSDEQGLLLQGERLPYAELRRWLEEVPAEVRIAILDSCASGALTREKGGVRAPPFLVDTSTSVKGHAILTSSAADEASQESDRIEASFFTHYLITGLRGAADASRDGRVTVNEAYQFAFHETLARTERTRSGPQHPAYDIRLAGSGDVVLTDLRGTDATLVFPDAADGRFFVRDGEERLVAELRKHAGAPVDLGLEPGRYRVTREDGLRLAEARVELARGARVEVPLERLVRVARELTAARGDAGAGAGADLARVPVDLSIFPPLSLNGDRAAVNRLQLGLIASRTTRLRGLGIAPVLWADEDVSGVQLAYIGNSARGAVTGVQLAMIANVAGRLTGFQSTTGLNLSRGDVTGVQLSTVGNWTSGEVAGAQLSNVANVAGAVRGLQLAVVNVAGGVQGLQLGIVNVARRAGGLQLGLVNVAREHTGAAFGLVNVAGDGELALQLLGDEDGVASAELVSGTRLVHTLWRLGVQRGAGGARPWAGFGAGVTRARGRAALSVDLLAQHAFGDSPHVLGTLRALVAWRVASTGSVSFGPTVNLFASWDEGFDPGVGTHGWTVGLGGADHARAWLGFAAGLRI
jgi:hypothetical protein